MTPRLARSLTLGVMFAGLTFAYGAVRQQPSDFAQLWYAARAWLQGIDPYSAVGPERAFNWPFPLLYPMPAVLAALPFVVFPLRIADALFVGLGMGLFGWVIMRDRLNDPRLLVVVSGAGALAMQTSQWSPLLCAAAFLPWASFLLACKPTLGLALLAAWPSWRTALGISLFAVVSWLAWPSWPLSWIQALPFATHMTAPILRTGGFLILIALRRWREPRARLLVAWASLPQTPELYEAVPLFLVAKTWVEAGVLAMLTIVVGALHHNIGGPYASYEAYMNVGGFWMLWLLYVPGAVWIAFADTASRDGYSRAS
jgi:hypothetical protein